MDYFSAALFTRFIFIEGLSMRLYTCNSHYMCSVGVHILIV